jgi:glycine cleavage system protein P-like pyridoxal-binding family
MIYTDETFLTYSRITAKGSCINYPSEKISVMHYETENKATLETLYDVINAINDEAMQCPKEQSSVCTRSQIQQHVQHICPSIKAPYLYA